MGQRDFKMGGKVMIQVSLTTLLMIGMSSGLCLLAFFWLWGLFETRSNDGGRRAREDLVHCRICGHIYENADKKRITACLQCGSLNEPTKPKPI